MKTISKLASVAVTATAVMAGSAATAGAYQIYPSESATTPLADGTTWEVKSGAMQWANDAGTTIWNCTGSRLTGTVAGGGTTLRVAGGGMTGCTFAGAPLFASINPGWNIGALSGASPSFGGQASGVSFTYRCGTPTGQPMTYAGTLGTDGTGSFTLQNAESGLEVALTKSRSLAKTGTGCPTFQNPARLSVRWKAQSVNGAPVSPTNNLWFK